MINANDDKNDTIVASATCAGKMSSPRYDGTTKKNHDLNINNEKKQEGQSHSKLSSSVKKIQNNMININNHLIKSSMNANSSINKYISKINSNNESLNINSNYHNHKKKSVPVLNEPNLETSKLGNHTPNNIDNISNTSNNNTNTVTQANVKPGKPSTTTPVTNKHSRKNSLEKSNMKNAINSSNTKQFINNNLNHYSNNQVNNSTSSNNFIKPTTSSSNNTSSQNYKPQTRIATGATSNYVTNNSNVSGNNSLGNLTNNSSSKVGVTLLANMNLSSNKLRQTEIKDSKEMKDLKETKEIKESYVNYEEINLVTDNSKKSQKHISSNSGVLANTVIKTNMLKGSTNPGTNTNSLAGSHNFTNNMKLFDIVQGNLAKTNSQVTVKKKPSTATSMPITNTTSKTNSKSNSKSASRADERIDTVRKKFLESESKKLNIPQGNANNESTNMNTLSIQTGINPNEKINLKKHSTSTNSPTHFPFNFNKDNILHAKSGFNINNVSKIKEEKIEKEKNSTSMIKSKEEAVTVTLKSKPGVGLKLGISSNSSNLNSNQITLGQSTNNQTTLLKYNDNSKKDLQIGSTHPNPLKAKLPIKKLDVSPLKNNLNIVNKNVKENNDHNVPNNTDMHMNLDLSIENLLDNSNSSIKSTVRESNYYKKEAEKISNYIKKHFMNKGEYPQTTLKFYKYGRLLGRGAFGKVNLCLHTVSGRLVAVKSFNKSQVPSEASRRKIFHETNLMKNLKHNSIVKIFEVLESSKYILIVMEFVCGGDLLSFVRKRTKLNEITAKFIFRQIIEALQYIHTQNIVHRDIKLDNILIDLGNNIKICDFGVSRLVRTGDVMHDQCGTPAYIAPEILRNEGYEGFGVDVWSAGVVLYAMLSGTVPFKATNMTDLHRIILSGAFAPIKDISPEASELISGILEIDPLKRLSTDQILNHEWLRCTDDMFNCKMKTLNKLNLFTNAERILLSKTNIDYRIACKDDLIENFTLKNLDTNQESENQNVNTKSFILAPFNSSYKNSVDTLHPALKIENDVLKFYGKAKENNRNYELNNNGEIDNGILINPQNNNNINAEPNVTCEKDDDYSNYNLQQNKNTNSAVPSNKISKHVSKHTSPPEINRDIKNSDVPSPQDETQRNSRKNIRDISITNANTFILDENVLKILEIIGYKKDHLLKCLYNNDLNYATAAYYLFLHSTLE